MAQDKWHCGWCLMNKFPFQSEINKFSPLPGFETGTSPVASRRAKHSAMTTCTFFQAYLTLYRKLGYAFICKKVLQFSNLVWRGQGKLNAITKTAYLRQALKKENLQNENLQKIIFLWKNQFSFQFVISPKIGNCEKCARSADYHHYTESRFFQYFYIQEKKSFFAKMLNYEEQSYSPNYHYITKSSNK